MLYYFSFFIRTHQLLDHHHGPCIRDIDSNPNRPYYFVSCGDDCTTQFWDWRKLQGPLVTRQDHSHWVWSVQYNLSYDQLVLSGSSDSQVSSAYRDHAHWQSSYRFYWLEWRVLHPSLWSILMKRINQHCTHKQCTCINCTRTCPLPLHSFTSPSSL